MIQLQENVLQLHLLLIVLSIHLQLNVKLVKMDISQQIRHANLI